MSCGGAGCVSDGSLTYLQHNNRPTHSLSRCNELTHGPLIGVLTEWLIAHISRDELNTNIWYTQGFSGCNSSANTAASSALCRWNSTWPPDSNGTRLE